MNKPLAVLALLGLILAATVHAASLAGIDVSQHVPFVWVLHAGIFVVFIPFVVSSRKVLGPKPSLSDMMALVPNWVTIVAAIVVGYAAINFALFLGNTQGGAPSIRGGTYVLENHGHFIREITPVEYAAFRANQLRGFSGHWLLFYFLPFAYFMFARAPGQAPKPR